MIINGAHFLIYTKKAAADKKFFKEVLKCPSVDVGSGWLIFGLPPAELAFHPSPYNTSTELYLMCKDIEQFVAEMQKHQIQCSRIYSQGWGRVTEITMPSGGKLGVYQPRHKRPKQMAASNSVIKKSKPSTPSAPGKKSNKKK